MAPRIRLVALVALSMAPAAVGPMARADDAPRGWAAGQVRFEPLEVTGSRAEVDRLAYRGTIEVQPGLSVVNELPVDDYVKGVVEMPATWPAAALQAQAIAARTYALNQRSGGADICPTDACQVYLGLAGEEREDGSNWAAAVDATAGQALLANGEPIRAEYSSSNGGRSVAGSAPYLRAVNDPDDAYSPLNHWHYTLPLGSLAPYVGLPDGSSLAGISRDGDTIVSTVQPATGDRVEQTMGAGDFAAAINARLAAPAGLPLPFPTMKFSLDTDGSEAVVDGRGWGHGRGMSQWGAYGKARRGLDASDILAAYYGGIRPSELPADQAATPIRVALASGRRSVAVTLAPPFRVVTGDGTVLAALSLGRWEVVPDRGGVRVLPPDGYDEPLTVTHAQLASGRRVAGTPPTVHFTVSAPALVTVTLTGPGLEGTEPISLVLLDAGDTAVALPRTRYAGDHIVTIEADGGPGRQAAAHLKFGVQGHSVFQASVERRVGGRTVWVALACLLAVAVSTGAAAFSRAGRS